ncbi:MAG: hypothetical protein JO001_25100 [Alphaproteobacteria bacterium]|nr:hypothetical protein [Alphaproteobacteria bacterium]
MRFWLLALAAAGLSACSALGLAPAGDAPPDWQTARGTRLSLAELDALRVSCEHRGGAGPLDSDQPVPNPIRDNPIYHPGGEGLANAPPTGISAADRTLELGTRVAAFIPGSVDQCLLDKGLVQVPR